MLRRGVNAHLVTLQVLFIIYQEAFLNENPDTASELSAAIKRIRQAFKDGSKETKKQEHRDMTKLIELLHLLQMMTDFIQNTVNNHYSSLWSNTWK